MFTLTKSTNMENTAHAESLEVTNPLVLSPNEKVAREDDYNFYPDASF